MSINLDCEVNEDWIKNKYFVKPDPNTVKIRQDNLNEYWYWIWERQNIWYKRVIQEQPAPWTDDEILREYKFTNAIRDIDRLTIYYIDNILCHMGHDIDSKKDILLNTMIYRLFVRIETWEQIGFLKHKEYKKQWEEAKERLRDQRRIGKSLFTSAYFVNDLKAANENVETNSNKLENAICLIESWIDNLDEIYDKGFVKAKDMKQQLKYFQTLPCIGPFTSYEWACDFAMTERYTGIPMVAWDDDSYANVGPGCKRGLDWIFKDFGNMTRLQAVFYIRSIWKSEMKRLGYLDSFKLPDAVPELNLRYIEHSLCEYQKFKKAKEGVGRPKVKFRPTSDDMSILKGNKRMGKSDEQSMLNKIV